MKKLIIVSMLALAALTPLAAAGLAGFGFTFGWDIVNQSAEILTLTTDTTSTYSGLGFNADVYLGQKLGFYGGGAFGLLTGIDSRVKVEGFDPTTGSADMADYDMKFYGEALVGLGMFLPVMNQFDLTLAGGFGLTWVGVRADVAGAELSSFLALGPGVSMQFGIPLQTNMEIYAACRAIYGLILLSDQPSGFTGNLSITPALGVKLKI